MHFYKLSGSGNDFIIIDNLNGEYPFDFFRGIVTKVTSRNNGVGADGLIILNKDDEVDFRWDFFNSDGSVAEMCGNGARCAGRIYSIISGKNSIVFKTIAGRIDAQINGDIVKVRLPDPTDYSEEIKLEIDGKFCRGSFINTGVPHFVVEVEDIESFPVKEIGNKIRFHNVFSPRGTNVNFVKYLGNDTIKVRTYERGVEDETLACGTGACASALVFGKRGLIADRANIITSGGERLSVYFKIEGEKFSNVYLEGRVRLICEGDIFLKELN
ncbi:MAG: diaminopimelate epimerase [Proteobacteria bacterium]|nr:diaminopimelate epimerase [Pseudomonadota bacterium]